jgi:hypothetical protein
MKCSHIVAIVGGIPRLCEMDRGHEGDHTFDLPMLPPLKGDRFCGTDDDFDDESREETGVGRGKADETSGHTRT